MGEIITFYSYKGGTGRTMALANVAWILAAAGHKVLVVDWDLEAPGLHRYFHPFLKDQELITSSGVIDLVIDFAVQATTPPTSDAERDKAWYRPLADVLRYAVSIDWDFGSGRLDLLPAGQQSASYATRVNSFNWDNFYERLGGGTFIEAFRDSMMKNYEYVLVDSRTGVSDTSGICTVQLPDKVVVCFTLNRQSIEGAAATARSVIDARGRTRRGSVKIFPVPTRVEKGETSRLEAARTASRQRFDDCLAHVPAEERPKYWEEIEIGYQPYYAYEEILASFRDTSPSPGTVLYSMERLAARLTDRTTIGWTLPPVDARAQTLGGYGWTTTPPPVVETAAPAPPQPVVAVPAPAAAVPSGAPRTPVSKIRDTSTVRADGDWKFWFYVSYAHSNRDEFLDRFVADLDREVRNRSGARDSVAFYDRDRIQPGEIWSRALAVGQTGSRTALCIVTQAFFYSAYCGREVSLFRELGIPMLAVPWLPIQTELPPGFGAAATGVAAPPRAQSSGVQTLLRFKRYADAYTEFLIDLATQIMALGKDLPARPPREVPSFDAISNAFEQDAAAAAKSSGALVVLAFLSSEEGEWRPYGTTPIGTLAATATLSEQFLSQTLQISDELPNALLRVGEDGRIWMLFVDAARLTDPKARKMLEQLDRQRSPGRVIVVWSASADAARSEVTSAFKDTFRYTASSTPQVSSEDELTTRIRAELHALRAEALRDAAARPTLQSDTLPRLLRHE